MFMDVFITLGLTQWVKLPTFYHSGNILDLVLTSEEDRIGVLELLPPFPNCGHCAVIFDYNFQFTSENSILERGRRSWFKGNYKEIERHLQHYDWFYELHNRSVNIT